LAVAWFVSFMGDLPFAFHFALAVPFDKWMFVIEDITNMNVSGLNLNLLPVLDALLVERSVSRAGRRLGLSQPAVSNALAQLRRVFDDPLFHRGRSGMMPTERALALAGPVRAALGALEEGIVATKPFVAARETRTFTLLMNDFVAFAILPSLVAWLAREAPGVRLRVRAWQDGGEPRDLEQGDADLAIGFRRRLPAVYRVRRLFEDRLVCVLRPGHPALASGKLTLADYLALSHVVVSTQADARGLVDRVLARRGLTRTVALQLSHFLLVPAIVGATDLVAALSESVAAPFVAAGALRSVAPPLRLPGSSVFLIWHVRSEGSPAHAWLRDAVEGSLRDAASAAATSSARPRRRETASGPPTRSGSASRRRGATSR
jgi:DNA-binding transcriptional LysR family regulator